MAACLGEHGFDHLQDEALLGPRELADAVQVLNQLRCRAALLRGCGLGFANQCFDAHTKHSRQDGQHRHRNAPIPKLVGVHGLL